MKIWTTPINLDLLHERCKNSLSDHLGIVFSDVGDDYLAATMPVDHRTKQPFGILHGGSTCALAETVASAAANFCIDQKTQVAVGLEINVNHMKPVKSGLVKAVAKPLHLGKTTQVWEIKIYNSEILTAVSRLTLAIVERR
jgi:1,4-dihydroxy-2-naphthoyl-CoA hydrolase